MYQVSLNKTMKYFNKHFTIKIALGIIMNMKRPKKRAPSPGVALFSRGQQP
jgi:hypothetical protein